MKTQNNQTVRSLIQKSIALSLITFLTWSAALAQTPVDVTHRFPGYEPTVFESDAQVNEVFKGMETRFKPMQPILLRFGSQCTQRAETWSYDLAITQKIKLEKVFVFYTHAYHDFYYQKHGKTFKWWFHVSPYLLVKNAVGQAEERVIDRSFADKPQTMKEWTDLFVDSQEACIENVPFSEFEGDVTSEGRSHNKAAHCYIVRSPMYDLFPQDIDAREKGQKNALEWDIDQVYYGAKALTASARKDFLARVGL